MSAIRDVRAHVAAALDSLDVPVHAYPPQAVPPPAVTLHPASPYRAPTQLGGVEVGVTVRLIVSAAAGPAAQAGLDDLIDAAVAALTRAGVRVDPVSEPGFESDGAVLVADLATFTTWED